jgi:hypothetical protein
MQLGGVKQVVIATGALVILGLGWNARGALPEQEGWGFFLGTLTLGGALLICALFSIRMPWHGLLGAGVVALMGAAKGLTNLPKAARHIVGEREADSAPLHELGITLVCLMLLVSVLQAWRRERVRRMLSEDR